MSASGRLVVLDRLGRASKQFPLASGAATLGRDSACDIRVLQPSVWPQHAIVVVHANQTVIRNVCGGETLVNGRAVSVAALRDGDVITVGDRSLRWRYDDPDSERPPPPPPQPALSVWKRGSRAPRRQTGVTQPPSALQLHHRASMPGNAGGKQVAIVQPQRRDTSEQSDSNSNPPSPSSPRTPQRTRSSRSEANTSAPLLGATKASLWIESRKAPRRTPLQAPRRAAPQARRSVPAPLRHTVLRRAYSTRTPRVTKIRDPREIDLTKQAALLLMAGGPRMSPLSANNSKTSTVASPNTRRNNNSKSVSVLEVTDSELLSSPLLPSPRKSALRDPKAKRGSRKTDSIKFDLSNLDTHKDDNINENNKDTSATSIDSLTDDDITLHYSDSSTNSPSPRRSIHSRSSKMLEKIGSPLKAARESRTMTPESPRSRKSLRGSLMLEKTMESSDINNSRYSRRTTKTLTDGSFESTVEAFKTRTLSPRASAANLESYSIVDLVSVDSNETGSVYDSVGSTRSSSIVFGTPRDISGRKTRSTIGIGQVTSSTPYIGRVRVARSNSNPNISRKSSPKSKESSRRSQSLTTPENSEETKKHISINSTKISRASKTRSRLDDSDLQLIGDEVNDESPRTSRRVSRFSKSQNLSPRSPRKSPNSTIFSSNTRRSRSQLTLDISQSDTTQEEVHSPNEVNDESPRTSRRVSRVSKSQNLSPRSPQKSPNSTTSSSNTRRSKSQLTLDMSQSNTTQEEGTITLENIHSPDEVNDISPRTSRRVSRVSKSQNLSPRSPRKSPNSTTSSSNTRRSRSQLTLDISQSNTTQEEGTITPENIHSPEDAGTPVLSIQSLLDSSQSSFVSQKSPKKIRSPNLKRKTIGAIRSGKKSRQSIKSKSFTASVRKSLRTLRLSRDGTTQADEDNVTPKSEVKPVQEAVKNKHSTSRKPQSKRSIIDNLNDSDIVKQLFNSPVKRKLSQSMTEFSRKKLFDDDDEVVVRRPTRNTVALTGRTLDNSILDNTDRYTPDNFVSPISTPSNSPNLTGIKRLYARNTPQNDLSNVKGVAKLLRTPRLRKSVKNDLTNVSGIKTVFAKSPRNRLSDVRVKEVFAASPKNDLRRVTGVKTLFGSQKKPKSPKNDLSDVRGVRDLFKRKSAGNDLRNISGVKDALSARSPNNDLRDVRGVRRMFRQEKEPEYHDVSGVEELFNESNSSHKDPEALFDQLIGKPPIKAVYSKSFVTKRGKKQKAKPKSLHTSIDLITNNVEQWLEQELQKRLHKNVDGSKKNSIMRELQKLATDTVEGSEPLRTSRVRTSNASESKRSASQVYSAHTLPIKKRSFVENSLDKSNKAKENKSNYLPIKKRAVVHSTPVKGHITYNMTLNASELGRVSPISAVDKTANAEPEIANRPTQQSRSPNQKGRRATKANIIEEIEKEVIQSQSPKAKGRKNSAKVSVDKEKTVTSPKQKRATRGKTLDKPEVAPKLTRASKSRKNTESEATAVKNKSDAVSPKINKRGGKKVEVINADVSKEPVRRTRNNVEKVESPKEKPLRGRGAKAKATESKDTDTKLSPKKTRGATKPASPPKSALRNKAEPEKTNTKKRRNSLVIGKKQPILDPKPSARATRNKPEESTKKAEVKSPKTSVATRKQKAETTVEKPISPKKTRAKLVVSKPSPQLKPRATRNNNIVESRTKESPKGKETKKSVKAAGKGTKEPEVKRGRNQKTVVIIEPSKTKENSATNAKKDGKTDTTTSKRGRKDASETSTTIEPPTKKSRKGKPAEPIASPKKLRGKKNIEEKDEVPPTRSTRRAKNDTVSTEPKTRKRKSNEEPVIPAKVAKSEPKATRSRKTVESVPKGKKTPPKEAKAKNTPMKGKAKSAAQDKAKKSPKTKAAAKKSPQKKPVEKKTKGKKAPRNASSSSAAKSPEKAARTTRSRRR